MQGNNVFLRSIQPEDEPFLLRLVNDPDATRYIQGLMTDPDTLHQWIASLDKDSCEFIVSLTNGTPIGECSIGGLGEAAEIGYMFLPEYWNKGYGTATVEILVQLVDKMGFSAVVATTDTRNAASVHLLEKMGFTENRQGWMLHLSEGGESNGEGQTVVEYRKEFP